MSERGSYHSVSSVASESWKFLDGPKPTLVPKSYYGRKRVNSNALLETWGFLNVNNQGQRPQVPDPFRFRNIPSAPQPRGLLTIPDGGLPRTMDVRGNTHSVSSVSTYSWGYLDRTTHGTPLIGYYGLRSPDIEEESIALRHPDRAFGTRYYHVNNHSVVEGRPAPSHPSSTPSSTDDVDIVDNQARTEEVVVGDVVYSDIPGHTVSSEIPRGRGVVRTMYRVPPAYYEPSDLFGGSTLSSHPDLPRLSDYGPDSFSCTKTYDSSSDYGLEDFSIPSLQSSRSSEDDSETEYRDHPRAIHGTDVCSQSSPIYLFGSRSTSVTLERYFSSYITATSWCASDWATSAGSWEPHASMTIGSGARGTKRSRRGEQDDRSGTRRRAVDEGTSELPHGQAVTNEGTPSEPGLSRSIGVGENMWEQDYRRSLEVRRQLDQEAIERAEKALAEAEEELAATEEGFAALAEAAADADEALAAEETLAAAAAEADEATAAEETLATANAETLEQQRFPAPNPSLVSDRLNNGDLQPCADIESSGSEDLMEWEPVESAPMEFDPMEE